MIQLFPKKRSLECELDGTEDYGRWCYKKGGGGGVSVPDPAETARAQGLANKEAVHESAKVNQINQVTPFGNVTFTGEIGSPERTQTLTISPEEQQALDAQREVSLGLSEFARDFVPRVGEQLSTPFNTADLGPSPQFNQQFRDDFEGALFDRINPQLDRDQERLENQLVNQGFARGSEAFKNELDSSNRARNDLRLAITGQGQQQLANDFSLQQSAHNQALSDALLNRTQSLNEVSALLQGAPAISNPGLAQPAQMQIAPADFIGAQQLATQAQIANQNAATSRGNGLLGGLAALGGGLFSGAGMAGGFGNLFGGGGARTIVGSGGPGPAAVLRSDRRLKTDIKRVGKTDGGLPVYTFRYKSGGPVQMGIMAQDLEKVKPEAVYEIDGFKAVDYAEVA